MMQMQQKWSQFQTVLIHEKFADFGPCVPSEEECSGLRDSLPEQACSFTRLVVHSEKGAFYFQIMIEKGGATGAFF